MLSKIKVKPSKGFLGAARTSVNAPYRQKQRCAELRSFGKESFFITPQNLEDIEKCPRGMKR